MRHPSVDSTSSSMRRMETLLKSYSSSARNSDSAGARYSSILAARDTHATASSRAAQGITDLCTHTVPPRQLIGVVVSEIDHRWDGWMDGRRTSMQRWRQKRSM